MRHVGQWSWKIIHNSKLVNNFALVEHLWLNGSLFRCGCTKFNSDINQIGTEEHLSVVVSVSKGWWSSTSGNHQGEWCWRQHWALVVLPSVQILDSGRCGSANGVEISRERIGLKEKEPLCDAKEAPQQPKREGTSSASILEALQVIKAGSGIMQGRSMGMESCPHHSCNPRAKLEALQCGSSLWIRISSCLPHCRDPCEKHTVHRPPPQQTKGQTTRGVAPSCFLNMQTYNKKEIGGKEIIRSTAVISI